MQWHLSYTCTGGWGGGGVDPPELLGENSDLHQ